MADSKQGNVAHELRERSEIPQGSRWDLTTLYASDDEWERAFQKLDAKIEAVAAYKGKLHSTEAILACLRAETELELDMDDVAVYASTRHSEDTRAEAAQSMYARVCGKYAQAGAAVAFVEPELLALPENVLRDITEAPELSGYRFALRDLLRRKPHTLTAQEEELVATMGEVFAAPKQIADSLREADLVFDDVQDGAGESRALSEANYILSQTSPDRTLRKNAFVAYYKTYRQHINTFAAAYAGTVKGSVALAGAYHYGSSREMSLAGENIPASVYDSLIEAVHAHMPAMHRYVALRKKLLGLDELHYYDLYVPLTGADAESYSYEQAKQMVLDTIAVFGKEYEGTVRRAYDERWVDVYPNKGKSGGAYSTGTYRSNPYILMNFSGTLDSVSTLAHEMGHSMHTWYAGKHQPPQYAGYTLFVAEVASTVNENLLIERLLKDETDPEKRLSLLNQYLENFKGTVYRQTMFAEFERETHAMAQRGESLNPASLNKLYRKLIADYFGPALVIDDEVELEWARIPHFYRPFYVYKYATGYSTAVALSEGIRAGRPDAVKNYLEFLSMGGSAYPLEELRHAGVDLTTPAPVDAALNKFEAILADVEATAAALAARKNG